MVICQVSAVLFDRVVCTDWYATAGRMCHTTRVRRESRAPGPRHQVY